MHILTETEKTVFNFGKIGVKGGGENKQTNYVLESNTSKIYK